MLVEYRVAGGLMDDSSSIWILFAVFWVAFGVGSAAIANSKNRNPLGYFFLGLIGLLIAVAMPALVPGQAGRGARLPAGAPVGGPVPYGKPPAQRPWSAVPGQAAARCYQCGSPVETGMQFCSYCGALLACGGDSPSPPATVIVPGMFLRVSGDVLSGGRLAFREGEVVKVEKIEPDVQRPEYRHVVYSSLLDRRFHLRDQDLVTR